MIGRPICVLYTQTCVLNTHICVFKTQIPRFGYRPNDNIGFRIIIDPYGTNLISFDKIQTMVAVDEMEWDCLCKLIASQGWRFPTAHRLREVSLRQPYRSRMGRYAH